MQAYKHPDGILIHDPGEDEREMLINMMEHANNLDIVIIETETEQIIKLVWAKK